MHIQLYIYIDIQDNPTWEASPGIFSPLRPLSRKMRLALGNPIFGQFLGGFHQKIICVNYNGLTATSLEIMVNKGNHPEL